MAARGALDAVAGANSVSCLGAVSQVEYVPIAAIENEQIATITMSITIEIRGPKYSVTFPARIEPTPVAPKYIPTMRPIFPFETTNS